MGRKRATKRHAHKINAQKNTQNVKKDEATNGKVTTDCDGASKEAQSKETILKNLDDRIDMNLETKDKDEVEGKSSKTDNVINIYSRLTYPFVESSTKDESEDSDDEEAVVINFWPRFIFASSLCLVCMETSTVVCEHCAMVSYCSVKHKQQGWPKHRELCKVLTQICTVDGALSMAKELCPDRYRIYRLKLIEIVESAMGRPLELWEKEILLYPRVCRTCHEFSSDLKCCSVCNFEFYCVRHENGHERWCRDLQVFRRILYLQHKHGRVDPYVPNFLRERTPSSLPENMDLLLAEIYARSSYYCEMDCHTYSTLSHISTIPLTTLYSLQTSCRDWETLRECTIHVIGAEFQFECTNLHVWEKFFLHFLPSLERLSLVFVGPELQLPTVPLELLAKVKLCSNCKAIGKVVKVSFQAAKCYHQYANSKHFSRADLLCLFNPGLYRHTAFDGRDTWPPSIKEFCKLRVPTVVTSYTEQEIPREVARIKSICDVDVVLEPQRNPFASIKPDRNFVSDDIAPLIYKNYYITIVKGK